MAARALAVSAFEERMDNSWAEGECSEARKIAVLKVSSS